MRKPIIESLMTLTPESLAPLIFALVKPKLELWNKYITTELHRDTVKAVYSPAG